MLTMRKLGKKGRFANCLFQYAYLRQESKGEYQCPPWIGQSLFGLKDPVPTKETPELTYKFPKHSSYYDERLFKSLFTFTKEFRESFDNDIPKTRPLVGIHLRRGDWGTFKRKSARWCFVAPTQWYLDWLRRMDLTNPIVFIASDGMDKVKDKFSEYESFYYEDGNYARDFYILTQCDYLLISNSTFGFAASMLSGAKCWRPRLSQKKLIPYDPWNSPLVFKDERY